MTVRIESVTISGIFSLDGEDFDVDNSAYVIGDDQEVVVIDAPHDHEPIVSLIAGRNVKAILCTHGHNDHINAAGALADATGAPITLHPDDRMLWNMTHPRRSPDSDLADNQRIGFGGVEIEVIHTPGHSPGSVCFSLPSHQVVFTGDTLFPGGPGATGRSFSSRETLLDSIEFRLFTLPGATVVKPGHGGETSIGIEAPSLPEWRTAD